jgi:hypothetical protein
MPLLGQAAMLLSFDIVPEAIAEHDEWHTHEHLPERLAIPGFRRGTRWVALRGGPRYFVMYEVERLETLASDAYLQRLNHPSAWTSKMMPAYRGMSRGLCRVAGSFGLGLGQAGLLLRFRPAADAEPMLRQWLLTQALPALASRPGLVSAHLFEAALQAEMTNEQRIRGADAGVDRVVFVTGYSADALAGLMQADLGADVLERHGAEAVTAGLYAMHATLTDREVGSPALAP